MVDGNPVAIGGYHLCEGHAFVFTEVKDEGRAYKWALYRGARIVMEMVDKTGLPALAQVDEDEPTSTTALAHFGFAYSHTADGMQFWRRDG